MRVLLINPSINSSKFGKFHILMEPMPCIGLAYIAALLEEEGHTVKIIDNFAMNYPVRRIIDIIRDDTPDIVGISVLTPGVNRALELASDIKKLDDRIVVIAGNVHPTLFPGEFIGPGRFDIVVRGEGEKSMSEVTRMLEMKKGLEDIRGISYMANGRIIHNEDRPIIEDLDSLPFPAWHLLPYRDYGLFPFADIKKPVLTVLATRGCTFRCKYCSLSYMDRTYRKRSVDNVVDEIEFLIREFGIRQFGFVDPIFPMEEQYALDFCEEMIRRGIHRNIVWTTETRIDVLNEKLIKALKEAGCRRFIFGLESGSEEMLIKIGKRIDFNKSRHVMKLIKKYKMETIGLFMIGLPGETEDLIEKTFRYARSLDIDFAKFAMTVPFPGSEFYETMKKEGKIRSDNWDDYTTFNPDPEKVPYVPEGLTAEKLIALQKKGTMDFYLRPRMIFRHLFMIRTLKLSMMLKGLYCLLT
ncbi:MAG: radical SAM protein [Elusimicrobiota bacterium]